MLNIFSEGEKGKKHPLMRVLVHSFECSSYRIDLIIVPRPP
jgi:hypothetical protein